VENLTMLEHDCPRSEGAGTAPPAGPVADSPDLLWDDAGELVPLELAFDLGGEG
jgi:hypothetical protein